MAEITTDAQAQKQAREVLTERAENELKRVVEEIRKQEIEKKRGFAAGYWNERLKQVRQLFLDAQVGPKRTFEVSKELEELAGEVKEKSPKSGETISPLLTASEKFLALAAK